MVHCLISGLRLRLFCTSSSSVEGCKTLFVIYSCDNYATISPALNLTSNKESFVCNAHRLIFAQLKLCEVLLSFLHRKSNRIDFHLHRLNGYVVQTSLIHGRLRFRFFFSQPWANFILLNLSLHDLSHFALFSFKISLF